ncbi:MAG: SDR family NAD(P)-dependent oxidoreductase [Dehalococcoidia bacterium]
MRLQDKVALISGGARGMGAVEARLFAQEGARVVIGDLLEPEGRQVEAEINENGGECLFVRLDVTSEINWQEAVATTVARFGKLDILVNNAGIYRTERVEETSVELWEQIMAINAKGVFLGTKHAIPALREAGGGSIVNISSTAGLVGNGTSAAYGASKGAVRIFTKTTAIQYAKDGIRANSVHPSMIETPMTEHLLADAAFRQERVAMNPLGRLGRPEDVAYGVLFLASDESSYMTGSELVIDGGRTAQ